MKVKSKNNVAGIKEISDAFAEKRGISKSEAEQLTKDFFEVIIDKIKNGGISIRERFGIKLVTKKGRTGTAFGTQYTTPDSKGLKLTVSEAFKQELNL